MVCGAHLAHWITPADVDYVLGWNKQISALSLEGYLQLSIYLRQWAEIIRENGWEGRVVQALADEPQENNGQTYRQIAAICRKFLPVSPSWTRWKPATSAGQSIIGCSSGTITRSSARPLKSCAVWASCSGTTPAPSPGGKIDEPHARPAAARLPVKFSWMGFGYNLSGFLHWGFNFHRGKGHLDRFLRRAGRSGTFPGRRACRLRGQQLVWHSLRLEAQRAGAEEYELLSMIAARDEQKAHAISNSVCRSFRDYTRRDPKVSGRRPALSCFGGLKS